MIYRLMSGTMAVIALAACSASKPTSKSPFVLVEGKKIGVLEMVEPENGFLQTVESKDSIRFDKEYLYAKTRIGFKYPGNTITELKVFDGEKLLKTCDEGSYSRAVRTYSGDDQNVRVMPNGEVLLGSDPRAVMGMPMNFVAKKKTYETYGRKYNLECDMPVLKVGMTIDLEDGAGLVSKYRVVAVPD